ncbi:choice-of-anchor P family protein [Sphingomonas kaistensis]|uniref:Choice-of-anchor P family protein n=1 Tax=Sphingomonas kaistensis TaxID=298708 RepID=A0ABZ2FZG8_9SPHN
MRKALFFVATLGLSLATTPALAQTASSSGYALSANETVRVGDVVTATVNIAPVAASSGTAPPSYNTSNSVASVNQSTTLTSGILGVTERVQTGLLTSNATGTSIGATGTATINSLAVGVGSSLISDPRLASLLSIGATTIQSQSTASSLGGLTASGTTTIEGLVIGGSLVSALNINTALFANPDPNTILLNLAGLSVILNEQILSGDGTSSLGITTNAIRVSFNNFALGTGLLNGDLIVGQSRASVTAGVAAAVPEPSTWAMMLLGFGAIGFAMRRRRSSTPALQMA